MHFPIIELLEGIGIGILVSIPLGPVGLITMKRTAEFGLKAGIISGFAIVLIDTIASVVILLSLHNSRLYFRHLPPELFIVGGIVIFFYGLRMAIVNQTKAIDEDLPWHKHFLSSVLLAITNPSTYFSFGIIGLLLGRFIDRPLFTRLEVAIGFFLGALLWWTILAFIAFTHREKYFKASYLQRIVGIIIMVLALYAIISHGHFL